MSKGDKVKCYVKKVKRDGKIDLTMKTEEDMSIRDIWQMLTDIEQYMLNAMQSDIPIEKDSVILSLGKKGERKLTATIDTNIHFENVQKGVSLRFGSDVVSHEQLPDTWYFEADVDLRRDVRQFANYGGFMYLAVRPSPVVEVTIRGAGEESRAIIKERLENYFTPIEFFSNTKDGSLLAAIQYDSHAHLARLKEYLDSALQIIQDGDPDQDEDGRLKEFAPAHFTYSIRYPKERADRFLASLDQEAMMDKEGLRFGSLRGQNFIVKDGDGVRKLGELRKIEKQTKGGNKITLTFDVQPDDLDHIKKMVQDKTLTFVTPDRNDMRGEFEKVNRLRDSFSRITDRPDLLVNPMLASYLFDASKATKLDDDVIAKRIELIKKRQLNESLNDSQIQAIAKAVEAKDLAIIQGPPGTGKSTAIAELIWQLAQQDPKSRTLLTSEANLAVDNALDRLKFSIHNIVKPIRLASGDKFSAEGFAYSLVEMKKWADVELTDSDKRDNETAMETDEYKSFNSKELALNRWMQNIVKSSRLERSDLKALWHGFLTNLPSKWRQEVYNEYVSHCNVIGATCSSISDTNYSASETFGNHASSSFLKRFRAVFSGKDMFGRPATLRFNTVIQDEASKATPAELSLPLVYGEKAVVIGDHRQLPPNIDQDDILFKLNLLKLRSIRSKNQRETEKAEINALETFVKEHFDILEKSHFERLFNEIDPSLCGRFDTQYRMHRDINRVIEQFYAHEGGLKCGVPDASREHGIDIPGLISPNNHVIWVNTSSPEILEGTSRANKGEVDAIEWVLSQLADSQSFWNYQESLPSDEDREIGLITFYGGQIKRLKDAVEASRTKGINVRMSSVDRFQGMERNIIIVSTVRSNKIEEVWGQKADYHKYPDAGYRHQKDVGFAKSPNRLNVALSRAKRLLIIVGNSEHFCNYVNSQGEAIYKNVFDEIRQNPNGRIIEWSGIRPTTTNDRVIPVPPPAHRSANLNTMDVDAEKDTDLRKEETWLTPGGRHVQDPHFAVLELSTKAVKLIIGRDEDAIKHTATKAIMTINGLSDEEDEARFDFGNFICQEERTETGKGLDNQNVMSMDYFKSQVLPAIKRMKAKMQREGVDVVYTVATAAYRTAKNRREMIDAIRREAGLNVRILTRMEESEPTMIAYSITSRTGVRYKMRAIRSWSTKAAAPPR